MKSPPSASRLFLLSCACCLPLLSSAVSAAPAAAPRNLILFIGDGMSVPQRMVAEEFSRQSGNGPLAMNALPCSAMTRTSSFDSLVTDSAAAATAIACGTKTKNHASGVDAEGRPLESCAVVARRCGRKVGIVSTVTVSHATPAGFYAHRRSRGDGYGIDLDLIRSGFDFFAGGGLDRQYDDRKHAEYIGDAYAVAESNGYRIVKTRAEFLDLKPNCGKILTRFTDDALVPAIDASLEPGQPSLAEIVRKAIEVLDNEQGFFLMAEGGRIDWAGHANDAATNLRDVLALDEAVKVALDYQKTHPDTLIVVTGDHETGGMSMGFAGTGYALYLDNLARQTMSVGAFDGQVGRRLDEKPALSFDEIRPLVEQAFGFKFEGDAKADRLVLSAQDVEELKQAFEHDVAFHKSRVSENSAYDGEKRYLFGGACRLILSHKCGIGWSSGAHTAMPVLTTAVGPGSEQFSGYIENTDIARILKSLCK